MEFRNLGRSGLRVSSVGLGCNNFGMKLDTGGTRAVVHAALEAGITLFDTADMYGGRGGSETQIGQVLGKARNDIVLATKFGWEMDDEGKKGGGSRWWIMQAVEDSLRRLKTDWIDLYQLHKPDPLTPIEETLRALDDLVRSGKVRYVGCSNLPAWQMVEAHFEAEIANIGGFVSAQEEYNMLNRGIEREVLPVARRYGFGLLPYFPLASGLLTGKYKRDAMPEGARLTDNPRFAGRGYVSDDNWAKVEKLDKFAKEHGHSLLQLAFGWLLAEPVTASVIAGATRPEQIASNVSSAGWKLTAEEKASVDEILA
jgi:aryl-alcohol dehydrogenase-like predicted oxidoreductase